MENKLRSAEHKRDNELENALKIVNEALAFAETNVVLNSKAPSLPPVFIAGNARSGTTLLYQWLSSSGCFAYPSNIMSRFYKAPYLGALIHRIMFDLDPKNELHVDAPIEYSSLLGKTKGANSPHEFWYFWREYFHFDEIQKLTPEKLAQIQTDRFLKDLASIETVFSKPLLMKAMILNWNLSFLHRIMPNAIFLFLKRNTIDNMASLYNARASFFNDTSKWYSFKPPEYQDLKNLDIYKQLAGQVIYTNRAIEAELSDVPMSQQIHITYEDFCSDPGNLLDSLADMMNIDKSCFQAIRFNASKKVDTNFSVKEAENAIDYFQSN